uniref:Uncharacterized protein n=1 Tax=Syphacia muris TaxID=451379 RepID=A0A0N5ALX3_9BILA
MFAPFVLLLLLLGICRAQPKYLTDDKSANYDLKSLQLSKRFSMGQYMAPFWRKMPPAAAAATSEIDVRRRLFTPLEEVE